MEARYDTHMKQESERFNVDRRYARVAASHTFRNICVHFGLQKKKVLDIGCSFGEHLRHFGPGSVGIALTDREVAEARTRGFTVMRGDIEDPAFALRETFDVIWANNLFEHLLSPHRFLLRTREMLTKGGILILGVPLIPRVHWLLRFSKFRGAFAVSHINFFTVHTLQKTVEEGGWRIREARSFHFKNSFFDRLLQPITPHLYVVASPTEQTPSFHASPNPH